LRPFNKDLKNFGMRPNFEVRPKAIAHLVLAQGHPCVRVYLTSMDFMANVLASTNLLDMALSKRKK
jgi:hypothetical protein